MNEGHIFYLVFDGVGLWLSCMERITTPNHELHTFLSLAGSPKFCIETSKLYLISFLSL